MGLEKDSDKKVINLWGLTQLGLVISFKSGVVYTNQTGGYSCMYPTEEGIFAVIGDDEGISNSVLELISKYTLNMTILSEENADCIDSILRKDCSTFFLSVDRSKLDKSMEAWIYVDIDEQPPVTIDSYRLMNTFNAENEWVKCKYSQLKNGGAFPFYGFGKSKGVLTWYNSD